MQQTYVFTIFVIDIFCKTLSGRRMQIRTYLHKIIFFVAAVVNKMYKGRTAHITYIAHVFIKNTRQNISLP